MSFFFRRLLGGRHPTLATLATTEGPVNDAEAYGVRIREVDVQPGTTYWKVIRVHHLTPEENGGNHHIYMDVLDEGGQRIYGAEIRVTWDGGSKVVRIDKPPNEPGTNFPMWQWQICAVEALGLPSDRVTGLTAAHPDEAPGNTLFHHSFLVVWQRAVKEAPPPPMAAPEASVVEGVVENGANREVQLLRDGEVVASTVTDDVGRYRFQDLPAGTYVVTVPGTDVQSEPVELDGTNTVVVNLTLPSIPEPEPEPGPEPTPVPAPEPEPSPAPVFERYVLFGPPGDPDSLASFFLAVDDLLQARVPFGFDTVDAAAHARSVIVVGDMPAEKQQRLLAVGVSLEVVRGSAADVKARLKEVLSDR